MLGKYHHLKSVFPVFILQLCAQPIFGTKLKKENSFKETWKSLLRAIHIYTLIYLKKLDSFLQLSYQNTRGLQSKLTKLYTDSFSLSSHLIVLTETWLKPKILSSEVFPSKYTTYRLDRTFRRGGGVLIAVDSELTSEIIKSDETKEIEFLCIKLLLPGISIYITCSYIPPSPEFPIYANHLSAIQFISSKLSDRNQLIVLGDFNIPRSTVETSNILLPSTQHDFLDGLLDVSGYYWIYALFPAQIMSA